MAESSQEPLLQETVGRYVMFPVQDQTIWDFYKKAQSTYWTAEEVDLSDDRKHWDGLNDDERFFIENVLAFFAASDGIVNENLVLNFSAEVQLAEARAFYAFQQAIETVHSEMYSLLIDTYVKDTLRKTTLLTAITSLDCVALKAEWCARWMDPARPFGERLVAFAAVEGIFFSASFCAVFWLKKRGLMPGLAMSNELISRDEALHRDFACLLLSKLVSPPSHARMTEIIIDAVRVESNYVRYSLNANLIGINAASMERYVEFVADHLLVTLGAKRHWRTPNPFDWMELLSLRGRANFFEKRESEYSRAHVGDDAETFCVDDEF